MRVEYGNVMPKADNAIEKEKTHVPFEAIDSFARCLLPSIQVYYESAAKEMPQAVIDAHWEPSHDNT